MVAFVLVGLFVGFPLEAVLGHSSWFSPSDVWTSFRGGQFTAWGDFSEALHYVSAPGTAILLAPPAFVAYHLGWGAPYPFPFPHPPAWELLDPYMLVAGSSVVFAVDALGRRLDIPAGHRILLDWLMVPFALPVVALWGHPEDVVAMAMAIFGAAAALDGRWKKVGWLFGFGCVLQPLIVLLLFPVMALGRPREWPRVVGRSVVPTALVMIVPLASTGGDILRFMREPNWISPNYPTPLLWISPSEGRDLVSAAPERALAVVASAVIGFVVWRIRATPLMMLWAGALAMAVRVIVEPVLTPYYLWPMAALLAVVIVTTTSWWALLPLGAASVLAYFHREPWLYWLPLVAFVVLAIAITGRGVLMRDGHRPEALPEALPDPAPLPVATPMATPAVPSS